jgi:hypothetical protein
LSIYKKFKTSETAESEGVELDYGESGRIRIARAGGSNKAYLRAIERINRKYKRQLQLDIMDDAVVRAMMVEVYADTVVLGWEGVCGEDGQPLKFTRDNVVKVFTDLPELFKDVFEMANNIALFKTSIDEAEAKN